MSGKPVRRWSGGEREDRGSKRRFPPSKGKSSVPKIAVSSELEEGTTVTNLVRVKKYRIQLKLQSHGM